MTLKCTISKQPSNISDKQANDAKQTKNDLRPKSENNKETKLNKIENRTAARSSLQPQPQTRTRRQNTQIRKKKKNGALCLGAATEGVE